MSYTTYIRTYEELTFKRCFVTKKYFFSYMFHRMDSTQKVFSPFLFHIKIHFSLRYLEFSLEDLIAGLDHFSIPRGTFTTKKDRQISLNNREIAFSLLKNSFTVTKHLLNVNSSIILTPPRNNNRKHNKSNFFK